MTRTQSINAQKMTEVPMSSTTASPSQTQDSASAGPLTGLRVVDFTRVLSGPFSTALLADLGAEVIKIESPGGDDYRHVGPFVEGSSALFAFANRGKKSVVLDLKKPEDLSAARQLASTADIVVENFRPGVADRLGIGYESLRSLNEKLIYASISGFGQHSPFKEKPAYDLVVQALTGLMSINGDADGPPMIVGEAFGDLTAGLFASWAILAAVVQRNANGKGCQIDVSMFDSLLTLMPTAAASYLVSGKAPTRTGNRHPFSAPFGAFAAHDGNVVIAVLNNKLFEQFALIIGRPDLSRDPRFQSDELRGINEAERRTAIEAWSQSRSVASIVQVLEKTGIPCAAIEDVANAVDGPQAVARSLFRKGNVGELEMRLPEQPVHFSTMSRGQPTVVPGLGQHNDVLAGLKTVLSDTQQPLDKQPQSVENTEVVTLNIDGPVATITINRPDAANALSAEVREKLLTLVTELESNRSIRAVILTGAGSKVFAAGSDIRDMASMTGAESMALSESILHLNNRISALTQPVICAVNGWCLGGGLELALACDIRIASDSARFGFPEAKLGIMTGGGGIPRLIRVVGSGVARHMTLTGQFLSAQRAYEAGLITQVCAPDELMKEAKAMAMQIATLAPIALSQIKRTIAVVENTDVTSGMQAEAQACAVCFSTWDKKEGINAFLEKRLAAFEWR
ncbi:L-carnitine dehydratase/bile acid-inducible protein F [Pseudomonas amygdali pv. sesami]|nr:L-carnitine dehydratase/bile acid-inducible protein F [Pseudomonas amygdali pv. sesami]